MRQSSSTTSTLIMTMDISEEAIADSPESRNSRIASRSEVSREITRPEVYFSWNSRLSRCTCRKVRRRRS